MSEAPEPWVDPDWTPPNRFRGQHVHNWKTHVTAEIQSIWSTFTDEQKLALYNHFEALASAEEWD